MALTAGIAERGVLMLATADFDSAVWTNKQHLAVGLAKHMPVYYVESLGLRPPRFSRSDLRRILSRLRPRRRKPIRGTGDDRFDPIKLTVITPFVLPFHRYAAVRRLNGWLLRRTLGKTVPPLHNLTMWTFSPLTYGLEHQALRTIYHSVDLIHEQERMPAALLLASERCLVSHADTLIASSTLVKQHLLTLGATSVLLWENVAHTDVYRSAMSASNQREARAIFAGNLTTEKLDLSILEALAAAGIPIALAGPIGIGARPDTSEIHRILQLQGVDYLGNLNLHALASEFARSMVGIIPYKLNEHSAGIFPMKVYEYLSAGLAVVSTNLPSLLSVAGNVSLTTKSNFVTAVQQCLQNFTISGAEARAIAAMPHSWDNRIGEARRLIADAGAQ